MFSQQQLQSQIDALSTIILEVLPIDAMQLRMVKAFASLPECEKKERLEMIRGIITDEDKLVVDLMHLTILAS